MKPTIGRIVHYINLGDKDGRYPPEQQAAIITGLNKDGTIALKVLTKTGMHDEPAVPFSATYERGHWTWPPREQPEDNKPKLGEWPTRGGQGFGGSNL